MSTPSERLAALGLRLPAPPRSVGAFRLAQRCGGLLNVSGHAPYNADGSFVVGKVGIELDRDQAKLAARDVGLAVLATIKEVCGSIDAVSGIVRAFGMVNCTPDFQHHPYVIDGFSELMRDVFGPDQGVGVRSAVGMSSLPFNIPVEVEATFRLAEGSSGASAARALAQDIHVEIKPVINAMGSMTSLGGSKLHPRALKAMEHVSTTFLDLNGLLRAAGTEAARLCQAPAGYDGHIVTGASAAIAHAVAACMAGSNAKKIQQLPDTTGMRSTVLADGASDTRWLTCVKVTGATVRLLGSANKPMAASELERALHDRRQRPAAMLLFAGGLQDGQGLPFSEVLELCHGAKVPVILDAAAQLPPRSNLFRWTRMGFDAVIFSGGKGLRGPQTSGLLLGRCGLIHAARLNGSPNELSVCRSMKCSKEDIVGLVAALQAFVSRSDEEEMAEWEDAVKTIQKALVDCPGVAAVHRVAPGEPDIQPNHIPRVYVDLEPRLLKGHAHTAAPTAAIYGASLDHGNPLAVTPSNGPTTLAHALATGADECIAVNTSAKGIIINPQTLSPQEVKVVARRVREEAVRLARGDNMNAKL